MGFWGVVLEGWEGGLGVVGVGGGEGVLGDRFCWDGGEGVGDEVVVGR